jgi:hypothetical protein
MFRLSSGLAFIGRAEQNEPLRCWDGGSDERGAPRFDTYGSRGRTRTALPFCTSLRVEGLDMHENRMVIGVSRCSLPCSFALVMHASEPARKLFCHDCHEDVGTPHRLLHAVHTTEHRPSAARVFGSRIISHSRHGTRFRRSRRTGRTRCSASGRSEGRSWRICQEDTGRVGCLL